MNLILYDFVVCIYTFILITFFIVWTIIGLNISNNEPKNSACYTNNGGFVIIAHNINLIVMIVFLTVGFLAFVITVIITACDEGSCTCIDLGGCMCMCMTCGCYNPYKKNDYKNRKKEIE